MSQQAVKPDQFELHTTDVLGLALRAWTDAEKQISELALTAPTSPDGPQEGTTDFLQNEEILSTLQSQQYAVIQTITNNPAMDINDVIQKLNVWKSIACPTESCTNNLTPADAIVLSVLNDILGQQLA